MCIPHIHRHSVKCLKYFIETLRVKYYRDIKCELRLLQQSSSNGYYLCVVRYQAIFTFLLALLKIFCKE